EAGEAICFGWLEMPFVWLPSEETYREQFTQWRVYLRNGNVEETWTLERTDHETGGMMKCRIACGDFLGGLSPGLHRIELTLRRGERSRVEAQIDFWYWQGLVRRDTTCLHLAAAPRNLVRAECRGFAIG